MKKITLILAAVVAMYFIVPAVLPISTKQALYAYLTDAEASMLGFEQKTADIGTKQISYYSNAVEGDTRTAMVLIHGFSADKDAWPRFASNLSEQYQIIIPDMAGHGDTGFDKNWSYRGPAQAENLLKLFDKLGIDKAHIVGNSMGGFIAAHFGLAYPERTLSATLMDPAGVKSPQPSDMELLLAKGENPFILSTREEFDSFFAMTMAKPPWFPDMLLDAAAENYKNKQDELKQIFADFHGQDLLDASLKDIKVPVLLLWGAKDQLIHVSSVEVWQGIQNIKTHVWPDIGHLPMMEIPGESAEVIGNFIESL